MVTIITRIQLCQYYCIVTTTGIQLLLTSLILSGKPIFIGCLLACSVSVYLLLASCTFVPLIRGIWLLVLCPSYSRNLASCTLSLLFKESGFLYLCPSYLRHLAYTFVPLIRGIWLIPLSLLFEASGFLYLCPSYLKHLASCTLSLLLEASGFLYLICIQ